MGYDNLFGKFVFQANSRVESATLGMCQEYLSENVLKFHASHDLGTIGFTNATGAPLALETLIETIHGETVSYHFIYKRPRGPARAGCFWNSVTGEWEPNPTAEPK